MNEVNDYRMTKCVMTQGKRQPHLYLFPERTGKVVHGALCSHLYIQDPSCKHPMSDLAHTRTTHSYDPIHIIWGITKCILAEESFLVLEYEACFDVYTVYTI